METRRRKRLGVLYSEYEKSRKTLDDLENQAAKLSATGPRIVAARPILEKERAAAQPAARPADHQTAAARAEA
ncbi:hypothetical protein [Candidatus Accumulibacter sp. ACC003]|uniref:hypothetical protein n=1 Tax=Candidatus Accumulibacter sp. ACC003 TaxID=2823334 RepID=UPI0025C1D5AC|nr:hypothetical protein [Candidatus Accumulibacter sp. ACC003]